MSRPRIGIKSAAPGGIPRCMNAAMPGRAARMARLHWAISSVGIRNRG